MSRPHAIPIAAPAPAPTPDAGDGPPPSPCRRCGGRNAWRRPGWMGGVRWHCATCEPPTVDELRRAARPAATGRERGP